MFWCSKYNTYIPCEGGDVELKKSLQEQEKNDKKVQNLSSLDASLLNSNELNVEKSSKTVDNTEVCHFVLSFYIMLFCLNF